VVPEKFPSLPSRAGTVTVRSGFGELLGLEVSAMLLARADKVIE